MENAFVGVAETGFLVYEQGSFREEMTIPPPPSFSLGRVFVIGVVGKGSRLQKIIFREIDSIVEGVDSGLGFLYFFFGGRPETVGMTTRKIEKRVVEQGSVFSREQFLVEESDPRVPSHDSQDDGVFYGRQESPDLLFEGSVVSLVIFAYLGGFQWGIFVGCPEKVHHILSFRLDLFREGRSIQKHDGSVEGLKERRVLVGEPHPIRTDAVIHFPILRTYAEKHYEFQEYLLVCLFHDIRRIRYPREKAVAGLIESVESENIDDGFREKEIRKSDIFDEIGEDFRDDDLLASRRGSHESIRVVQSIFHKTPSYRLLKGRNIREKFVREIFCWHGYTTKDGYAAIVFVF